VADADALAVSAVLDYDHDMTQAELARKVRLTQAYVSRLLSGKRGNPSLENPEAPGRAPFDVPVGELLE
jgi:transcriptional regulator with XRE-family HTH domain